MYLSVCETNITVTLLCLAALGLRDNLYASIGSALKRLTTMYYVACDKVISMLIECRLIFDLS